MRIDREEVPEPERGSELNAFERFAAVVRILRQECPWDREQTHESVRHLLIEEAYEVLEAIDEGDAEGLEQELGDVLLHVAFHAVIAEESDRFDLEGVLRRQTKKLVRRHPHVFGDAQAEDADQVLANWEKIKQQERGVRDEEDPTSVLEGVPAELPALLRAYRVQEKAAGVGFDFPERSDAWDKVEEELDELREQVETADPQRREAEFGDLLFALVNYARFLGVNPENALRATVETFSERFRHVERRLAEEGTEPEDSSLSTMDRYWEEAKRLEPE